MPAPSQLIWTHLLDSQDYHYGPTALGILHLHQAGVPVPKSFVIPHHVFKDFLQQNKLDAKINSYLGDIHLLKANLASKTSSKIKSLIANASLSQDLALTITKYYNQLGHNNPVVIYPDYFLKQNHSHLSHFSISSIYAQGDANLLHAIKSAWASLFDTSVLLSNARHSLDNLSHQASLTIQHTPNPKVSGTISTSNPLSSDKNTILVEAVWGLPDKLIQGKVTPDKYVYDLLKKKLIHSEVVEQNTKSSPNKLGTKTLKVSFDHIYRPKLSSNQISSLAKLVSIAKRHFLLPQIIHFALDKNFKFLRAYQTQNLHSPQTSTASLLGNLEQIASGTPISPGLVSGKAVHYSAGLSPPSNSIVITDTITPTMLPLVAKASAIVSQKGGLTSHAAIFARELSIPAISNITHAKQTIKNNQTITINAYSGDIFKGSLPKSTITCYIKSTHKTNNLTPKTATKTLLYLENSKPYPNLGLLPSDGIGFVSQSSNAPLKAKKQLSNNLIQLCQYFGSRTVMYQLSNSPTKSRSPDTKEENPFLGFRGASRHIQHPKHSTLELNSIKDVLKLQSNLHLILPLCRTPTELILLKRKLASHGLVQSSNLKFWLAIDTPSSAISLKLFAKSNIHGITINVDSLATLTLATDSTNSDLINTFDVADPSVQFLIKQAIKTAKKLKLKTSIFGKHFILSSQLISKAVNWGVEAITTAPISLNHTKTSIHQAETHKLKTLS